ncbi:MAG: isoprenoid biosynthesis glyoxalase ElbB, partial [Bacteroidales bacterium]|nr:isoprenoid biosynthesis glyoxalase ElbB [Bacteroidales bacterium]
PMKCFAIVLSGCGVYDGSEIGEAMMTMLALDEAGCRYEVFAPDKPQFHVVDHLKGEPAKESRNVLTESARIARGKVRPLSEYKAENYDGLIFPGGFGAAKNLCTFAFDGAGMTVDAEVERVVNETRKVGKPLAAMCIAPVILGKLIAGVQVTVGHDEATNEALRQMGAEPKNVFGPEVVHDAKNNVFTTPCYMLPDATIATVAACCRNLVGEMLK